MVEYLLGFIIMFLNYVESLNFEQLQLLIFKIAGGIVISACGVGLFIGVIKSYRYKY